LTGPPPLSDRSMASLALDQEQRPAAERTSRGSGDLIDARAITADLEKLAKAHTGNERDLRSLVAQKLKVALTDGRAKAEQLLLKDRHGRRCAERLCRMEDEVIRILFEFARKHLYPSQNPSEAERMAVVATGGYGRGLQAPGSDIDLLFLLPYKQTAWGESIAEAILYCLWDLGLKVGHATRSVDECIRQAKADMTIRTAILEARFLLGDRKLFDELVTRFDQEVVKNTAVKFVAAKRAVFDKQEYQLFRRCEDFLWSVRCHMHFVTGRAEERLSFDIQREIAVRLGYTEHPGLQ